MQWTRRLCVSFIFSIIAGAPLMCSVRIEPMSKNEFPRVYVEQYEKGVVCGGAVFTEYVCQVTEDNVDEWMAALTPGLLARFRLDVEDFKPNPADYLRVSAEECAKMRHAASLMRAWFRQRRSEPGAAPNGGPVKPPGDSEPGGGPPSVS